MRCYLKKWPMAGMAVILGTLSFTGLVSADEPQNSLTENPYYFQGLSNTPLDTFFLNFSKRYYRAVESSLQGSSYFAFRYYLNSPFESFDKRQFISENAMQANDLAQNAFHNAIRKTIEDIELLTIIRDYLYGFTSLQMRIGSKGSQFYGPSFMGTSLTQSEGIRQKQGLDFKSGLTFTDDLRLGIKMDMGYRQITSKLSYYPTSRNEISYTAETQLTASSKIGLSYQMSRDDRAVATTLSLLF